MAKELRSNVHVEVDGVSKWYGPDYPDNGQPPEGAVSNEAAFAEAEELVPREVLEANADPTRAGADAKGVTGADETGDQSRQVPARPRRNRDE